MLVLTTIGLIAMDFFGDIARVNTWTIAIGLTMFTVVFWLVHRPRNLPPGPWGWPVLGYIPQLLRMKSPTHETLSKLGQRYGPVYSFYLANQLIVVLQDYDVIKKVLATYPLSGRPTYEISQKTLPGHGVLTASGKKWTELRKFSVATLRGLGMGKSSFEKQISSEATYLLEEIRKQEEKEFDPHHLIENSVANVICSVVFGKRFEYTDVRFRRLINIVHAVIETSGGGGFLETVPIFSRLTFLPAVRKQIAVNESLQAFMKEILEDHDEGYDSEFERDYIDAFYNEMRAKERQGETTFMNSATLYHTVTGLFGAGMETTASSLCWGILYMIAYPEIQTRIQQEMDGVVGRDRLPRLSDKVNLPFTQAVLFEIQRKATVVPLSVPHKCMEDTTVSGYQVPKGAIVVPNLWHVHHEEQEWTNPNKFKPERFLDIGGKLLSRDHLIPFGTGRRVCLGEHLARMELFIVFTFLLHQFTFEKPDTDKGISFRAKEGLTRGPVAYEVRAIARV